MTEVWQVIEAQVRKAAWEASRLPKPPPMSQPRPAHRGASTMTLWGLDQEIFSTMSPRGRALTNLAPDPFKVYVVMECCAGPLTEKGFIDDTKSGWDFMSKVVARLKKDPWITDAGWESYNQAVAYIWVHPLLAA